MTASWSSDWRTLAVCTPRQISCVILCTGYLGNLEYDAQPVTCSTVLLLVKKTSGAMIAVAESPRAGMSVYVVLGAAHPCTTGSYLRGWVSTDPPPPYIYPADTGTATGVRVTAHFHSLPYLSESAAFARFWPAA